MLSETSGLASDYFSDYGFHRKKKCLCVELDIYCNHVQYMRSRVEESRKELLRLFILCFVKSYYASIYKVATEIILHRACKNYLVECSIAQYTVKVSHLLYIKSDLLFSSNLSGC